MIRELTGRRAEIAPDCFVATTAELIGQVRLAEGASVWFGAVMRADLAPITVGRSSNIQDGCVVHVDAGYPTEIGDYVTVGHRAVLHGCRLGDRVLVGMGAVVLNGASVGEGALIGAGAVVPPDTVIPPFALAVGIPARVVRDLGAENAARQQEWAEGYRRLWEDNYR
ncbi:MAG: gamma carbonic anhydrase family protein [Bacillota bacterium]|nr:gamma carbonic anhydrase family protein [Bacillota bacterium]